MTPADDIPLETPPSQTERPTKPGEATAGRSIGPESESRGGPQAPDETLDDKATLDQ